MEALKRDPEYAEAWCKLGSEITGMSEGEDTDKKLAGMDLFKDEPKITDKIGRLYIAHINAAIFCFDKAIEIEPNNVFVSNGRVELKPEDETFGAKPNQVLNFGVETQ